MVRLSAVLENLPPYPFAQLRATVEDLRARGVEILDFGMGEPREETPPFIREALAAAPMSPYPATAGLPELRAAIARWAARRYGVPLEPGTDIIPTLGTKEAIFAMAALVGGDLVAIPSPSYPVPARGAAFAGRKVLELPLLASNGFLPDLDAIAPEVWDQVGLLWLNYPNNPTAALAPLALYERAAELAREHDFLVCSDEAYSEIYFGPDPPASILEVSDRTNVLALNTLSKRSAMPGYRSGFAAGDPVAIAALARFRPNTGTVPQEFVQRVSVLAWDDEEHVEAMRATYRAKRDVLLPACQAAGLEHVGGDATMFLWLRDPGGVAAELLERGIVLAPGEFFGAEGAGYARLALVPPLEVCERAASLIGV
jgi:aspartate/methionine/tyrosine aminotransferase